MGERELKAKVLDSIIRRLGIEGIDSEDPGNYNLPIFNADDEDGVGIGLDSIDAMEVVIAIKEDFGVKIGDDDMDVLKNVSSIADFINSN